MDQSSFGIWHIIRRTHNLVLVDHMSKHIKWLREVKSMYEF